MIAKQLVSGIRRTYKINFTFFSSKVKQHCKDYASTMHFSNPEDLQFTKNWTSKLRQDTPISLLSLPGTHDSVTYSSSSWWQLSFASQCQSWSILTQLQSGIRFLDLRVKFDEHGKLITHHGPVAFEDFLVIVMQISFFLSEHPDQFVIAAFQGVKGIDSSQKILQMFRKHKIPVLLSKSIPTVGAVRGKVWIYGGYHIDFKDQTFTILGQQGVKDYKGQYYIQNCYSLRKIFPIDMKVQQMLKTAFQLEDDPERMKINFLSASGLGFIDLFRWLPYKLAFHQEGPNAVLYRQLDRRNEKAVLGVTIMDFPSNLLIESIIGTNSAFKS